MSVVTSRRRRTRRMIGRGRQPTAADIVHAMATRGKYTEAPWAWRGLVGLWPLRGSPRDFSEYNHSSPQGDAGFAATERGIAGTFDRVGDYFTWTKSYFAPNATNMSMSVWCKPGPTFGYQEGSPYEFHIFEGYADSYELFNLRYNAASSGHCFEAAWRGNAGTTLIPVYTIASDALFRPWHHLCAVISADTADLYYNGQLVDTHNDAAANPWQGTAGCEWNIGYGYYGGGGPWDGWIQDVCLWNRSLRASEVSQLYNDGGAMVRPRRTVVSFAGAAPAGQQLGIWQHQTFDSPFRQGVWL